MTGTNADESTFERAVETDATVKMMCGCNHESSYASFSDFNRARHDGHIEVLTDGDWGWAFANGRFRATCPTCGGHGETATLVRQPHDTIIIEMESSMPDQDPNREAYFSPAAALSEKRAKYTDVLDDDPAVEIKCGCGFHDQYFYFSKFQSTVDSGDLEFELGGDHLPYALAGDDFTLTCPNCEGDDSTATLITKGGKFIIEMGIERASTCPSCDAYIQEAGFKAGPEAPEIGWDYYECPNCDARTRPDAVGGQ